MKYRQPRSPALVKAFVYSLELSPVLIVILLPGPSANPSQPLDESESAARQAKTYAYVLRESAAHTLHELPANDANNAQINALIADTANAAITIDTAANTITSGSALPVKETLQALIPKTFFGN